MTSSPILAPLQDTARVRDTAGTPPGARAAALPEVPAGCDLAPAQPSARLVALCFALTLLVYLALVPRFILYSSPPEGDQAFYLMTTISIVQDHDLNERNNYANRDEDKFYALAPHPPGFVGMQAPIRCFPTLPSRWRGPPPSNTTITCRDWPCCSLPP